MRSLSDKRLVSRSLFSENVRKHSSTQMTFEYILRNHLLWQKLWVFWLFPSIQTDDTLCCSSWWRSKSLQPRLGRLNSDVRESIDLALFWSWLRAGRHRIVTFLSERLQRQKMSHWSWRIEWSWARVICQQLLEWACAFLTRFSKAAEIWSLTSRRRCSCRISTRLSRDSCRPISRTFWDVFLTFWSSLFADACSAWDRCLNQDLLSVSLRHSLIAVKESQTLWIRASFSADLFRSRTNATLIWRCLT